MRGEAGHVGVGAARSPGALQVLHGEEFVSVGCIFHWLQNIGVIFKGNKSPETRTGADTDRRTRISLHTSVVVTMACVIANEGDVSAILQVVGFRETASNETFISFQIYDQFFAFQLYSKIQHSWMILRVHVLGWVPRVSAQKRRSDHFISSSPVARSSRLHRRSEPASQVQPSGRAWREQSPGQGEQEGAGGGRGRRARCHRRRPSVQQLSGPGGERCTIPRGRRAGAGRRDPRDFLLQGVNCEPLAQCPAAEELV